MTYRAFQQATARLAYVPKGMMFSELFLFHHACRDAGVQAIAESGVANGLSTRVLRALGWSLTSFDKDARFVPRDLRGVVTIADGRHAIPAWIDAHRSQPVAVLLDGPKGPKGAAVRDWCLTQPHVRVVAQHDSRRGLGETQHSRDPQCASASVLDERIPDTAPVRTSHGLGLWINPEAWP